MQAATLEKRCWSMIWGLREGKMVGNTDWGT